MIIVNNKQNVRYLFYEVGGIPKSVKLGPLESVEISELISTDQIIYNSLDYKLKGINERFGTNYVLDFTTDVIDYTADILNTSPAFWIDATYSPSTIDSLFRVSQINDLVGSNNATQTVDSKKPLLLSMGNVKNLNFTVSSSQFLEIPNAIKNFFIQSFTINFVVQSNNYVSGTQTYLGCVDTGSQNIFIWQTTTGTFEFQIANGTVTSKLTTLTPVLYPLFNPKPIIVTATYDSTVNGIGGLKIYVDGVLQTDNGINRGNTNGFNAALFNPASYTFGWGVRNGATPSAYFDGYLPSIMIHTRLLTTEEQNVIYNFYLGQT